MSGHDDITYEIHQDQSRGLNKHSFYIRSGHPYCYVTENMTETNVKKVARSMRQLGFTVIDRVFKKG